MVVFFIYKKPPPHIPFEKQLDSDKCAISVHVQSPHKEFCDGARSSATRQIMQMQHIGVLGCARCDVGALTHRHLNWMAGGGGGDGGMLPRQRGHPRTQFKSMISILDGGSAGGHRV